MLFSSILFITFFFIISSIYFFIPYRFRWFSLLMVGYYFYLYSRPEYLLLILFVTIVNYGFGRAIDWTQNKGLRRLYLASGLLLTLCPLFYFKYSAFFEKSLNDVWIFMGRAPVFSVSDVALPVGISFFTFLAMGYTIDVYLKKTRPEKNLGIFALFVSFFPILLSGPIERSNHLIPQLTKKSDFDYERVMAGLIRIGWGLFKKIVIADRLALYVNEVYGNSSSYEGLTLIAATYFFTFQIYCDFSGYTDIAIGTAKVLGIEVIENFNKPYLARSIPDFWRRWHISLSTWLRDYIYIPLGGNRRSVARRLCNIFVTFLVCGIWHGANWTFIFWGVLYSFYYVISVIKRPIAASIEERIGGAVILGYARIIITFHLVAFAWIFFRADTMADAITIIHSMGANILSISAIDAGLGATNMIISVTLILFLFACEWVQTNGAVVDRLRSLPMPVKITAVCLFAAAFALLGVFHGTDFIYFNF